MQFLLPLCVLVLLSACTGEPTPAAAERRAGEPLAEATPVHVDSFIPRDEALRRFRRGLPPTNGLSHGMASRESLVRAFVRALERRDSTTLRQLVLSRAEFAYLYYPSAPQGLPPYDMNADLMWFMLSIQSEKGMHRALNERGGSPLYVVGTRCNEKPDTQGENTLWGPCVLRRIEAPGDTLDERLFGPIIERQGSYKFLTYANKL
ncbi:MAG TPA: hypothetical protein VFB89_15825 [Gemmatimonadales bacterium]|nr:hypothetical protein [Gemmatimonadales bacterium]